jgi:hypothetical protein
MILYHGTYESRAKEVFSSGYLKCDGIEFNYESEAIYPTTKGFVYLTENLPLSIYYGARVISGNSPEGIFVFEVDISEEELEVDYDEIEVMSIWPNVKKQIESISPFLVTHSLELLHSVRVRRDLKLGVDVKKYLQLPFGNNGIHKDDELNKAVRILLNTRENSTEEQINKLAELTQWKYY